MKQPPASVLTRLRATSVDEAGKGVMSARLLTVRFEVDDDASLWSALYRIGHPVQYAHVAPKRTEAPAPASQI